MKITKILVALSFLFAVAAQAGEMTVTGNMQATYQSEREGANSTTGNPLGMDKELKFSGSTELDNGMTVSVMQDTSDALAFGNSQISFGNVMGLATVYVGSDHDPLDAVDDITPSAFEEANGAGSGTYGTDLGASTASNMGLGLKVNLPVLGAVNFKHYPKVDGVKNADKSASGQPTTAASTAGHANVVTITTDMGEVPFIGDSLAGLGLTTGYAERENTTIAKADHATEATVALKYAFGPASFGYQKKYVNLGDTSASAAAVFYKDDVYGVVYAVNDALSISYNRYESYRHDRLKGSAKNEQSTNAFNIGYVVGGMTIGFQDAQTDDAGYVKDAKDDTRTLSVAVAF
jgi:hypothetical protein